MGKKTGTYRTGRATTFVIVRGPEEQRPVLSDEWEEQS